MSYLLGSDDSENFAVKKYTFNIGQDNQGDYHYRMALLEIDYLRVLKQCENIVQLK